MASLQKPQRPHTIGQLVYITDKFEPNYMKLGVVTGFAGDALKTAVATNKTGYWVRIKDDSDYQNIYFHDELQSISQDLKPAFMSYRMVIGLMKNGMLPPLADPFGAMGGTGGGSGGRKKK